MVKTTVNNEAIGFDLGETIFTKIGDLKVPYPDALRVIQRLVAERFHVRSYIISKVNEEQEVRAKVWIKEHRLLELTGIPRENVHFCRERCDKAPICKTLNITHFVDDRPEVLSHMKSVPNRFLFRGINSDFERFGSTLEGAVRVNTWRDIEKLLL